MKRLVWLLVLCGCPQKGGGTGPTPPMPPGVGCPAASGVFLASYLTSEPGKGHTGWVLPLHDLKVDTIANQPEFAEIDATTASALGVPEAPRSLWLMLPNQAPCRATVGAYYGAAVDSGTPNVTYGVELTGCAAPPTEQQQDAEAIALVSDQAPSECQVVLPRPVAARLGEMNQQKLWQRPAKETAIPAELAPAIPAHDCRPPGCETLWSIAQVDVGGKPVAWAGAINWLQIPPNAPPATQCQWKTETFGGFFVPGPDGKAVKVTEGQDHPLLLTTALADRSGPRALIAEGSGEYAIYDLAGGAAKLGHHLVWLMLKPEAYAVDERLGPECNAPER